MGSLTELKTEILTMLPVKRHPVENCSCQLNATLMMVQSTTPCLMPNPTLQSAKTVLSILIFLITVVLTSLGKSLILCFYWTTRLQVATPFLATSWCATCLKDPLAHLQLTACFHKLDKHRTTVPI